MRYNSVVSSRRFSWKVIIIDLFSSEICKHVSFPLRSSLTSNSGTNHRHKSIFHSDDLIFEHPEVTIKPPTLDDKVQRRLMTTTKPFNTNEHGGGSVPNILEHPDIRTPIVMETQQLSLSSSSASSSSSSDKRKLFRQQSGNKINRFKRKFFIQISFS